MRSPLVPPQHVTLEMSDGYPVFARYWPREKPRAAVLYLHGIQSHGGWYEWSASLLAVCGCAVLMPDRRGSGRNAIARGDTPNGRRWLDDVDEQLAWLSRHAAAPPEIVGVSWGGKLACSFAIDRPTAVGRLLLIAPGVFPRVDLPASKKFWIGISLIGAPDRQFEIPLNDPALFTDNPAGRDFICRDPLKLTSVTARFLLESRRLDRQLWRSPDRVLQPHVTAVLCDSDRIIHSSRTHAWLLRVCAQHPAIIELKNYQHTPEFDRNSALFERDIRRWAAG